MDETKLRLWLLCEAQAVQLRLAVLDPARDAIEANMLKTKARQIAEGLVKAGATAAGRV
jgi:hypothetical protein